MKPRRIPLNRIGNSLADTYDLFICASSYEDRCLSIVSQINVARVSRALIVSNMDLLEHIRNNKETIENQFGNKGQSVEVSTLDPLLTADSISSSITKVIEQFPIKRILLDVTTFTHESLLILLRLLRLHSPDSSITVLYASAAEYSIGDEFEFKWLSRGIGEIRSVFGYPGNITPSRKTHLIIVVGYEHERASGLIEALEPHSISLGYGRSGTSTTAKDQGANERYMELVKQMASSYSPVNTFDIPCDDPGGTCEIIERQIALACGMNVMISPMNNKLSTIGVASAAFKNDDVQLSYAQALRYNCMAYSTPGDCCYVFEMTR
jgi:hypothetical protein